jgi:hypothetical protein
VSPSPDTGWRVPLRIGRRRSTSGEVATPTATNQLSRSGFLSSSRLVAAVARQDGTPLAGSPNWEATLRQQSRSSILYVRRVLVTGMSGTGKSTALGELSRRGFRAVDSDEPGWTVWDDQDDGYVWREDRMAERLAIDLGPTLYVSCTVSNQGASIRSSTRSFS